MQLAKYHRDNVSIANGEELMQTFTLKDTTSGSPKDKVFCRQCGCTLWTIPSHHGGVSLIIRTSLLEGGSVPYSILPQLSTSLTVCLVSTIFFLR